MQVQCGPGVCISFHTGWWDTAANSWGKSRIWDTAAGVGGFEEDSLRSTTVIHWEWTGAGGQLWQSEGLSEDWMRPRPGVSGLCVGAGWDHVGKGAERFELSEWGRENLGV